MAFSFSNQKEVSIAIIVIVILIMVFKPSILGIMYNNILGKLFLVACIVFLTLKHTIAGLLGVVFIAVIASNSVFEGNTNKKEEEEKKDETPAASVMKTEEPMENEGSSDSSGQNVNLAAAQAALNALQ
jgi:hypothetical protein